MPHAVRRPHPSAPRHRAVRARRRRALIGSLAGLALAAGVVGALRLTAQPSAPAQPTAALMLQGAPTLSAADLAERRDDEASRSDSRERTDPGKARVLSAAGGKATTVTDDASDDDPRDIARALLPSFGWAEDQFGCLDSLWTRESNWRINADNPSSSAYGIPQALPGSKMSSAGADWATNPVTQITWGLGYIRDRYGSPCGAWGQSESAGWY